MVIKMFFAVIMCNSVLQVCFARMVLNYACPDEVLVSRLLARAVHSGRIDDNQETIKKRISLFHEKTAPVIEHYDDIVATVSTKSI